LKKTRSVPLGEDAPKDTPFEVTSIDRVAFEETLRYAEIPEFLSEIKQKIGAIKKPLNQEQRQTEEKQAEKIESELAAASTQQPLSKLLTSFFESKEHLKKVNRQQLQNVRVIPEPETIRSLQLAEDSDSDYLKVDLQIRDKAYIVLVQINKAINYR